MRIHQAIFGLAALLTPCFAGAYTSEQTTKQTTEKDRPCATAPRNSDGDRLLQELCAAIYEIAEGEQEKTVAYPKDDEAQPAEIKLWRNENGTAIDIDFGGGKIGSAVIARLLSGSVFVPTDRIDLLTIRNASIQGVLDLSNATIEVATRFDSVRFNPQKDGMCDTESAGEDERPPQAIRLVGTRAKKRLSLLNSQLCGDLVISGSGLDSGMEIFGTILESGLDCVKGQAYSLTRLFVVKSTIQSDMLLRSACILQDTQIERSTINSLTLHDAEFRGPIKIVDNTIGALSGWDSKFHDQMQIANNRVQAELNLSVASFAPGSAPTIRDNAVDGRLQITVRGLGRGKIIDLPHNRVKQASEIWLPRGWRGRLNLNDTVFESVLSLCMADYDEAAETLTPHQAAATEEEELRNCSKASSSPEDRMDYLVVNLKSAEVATLAWRLPLKCSIRWEGTGLRYENWGEGRGSVSSEYQCPELIVRETKRPIKPSEGLMMMRYVMMNNDIDNGVDALDKMADYLEGRGQVVESRNIREEAKRADYLNISDEAGLFDRWSRAIASVVLRPVGYGAKPELSLIWLGALWIISYAIYEIYSLALRRSWHEEIKAGSDAVKGYSSVPGFKQFDREQDPKEFEIIRYSIDAMLPVINLHTYDRYYTRSRVLRVYAGVQHAVGWFLITIFLVSAAIL